MNPLKLKKILAFASLVSLIIYVPISLYFESYLPKELQNYLLMQEQIEPVGIELMALLISIPLLIANVVSVIAILLSKGWGDRFYLYSYAAILILSPFLGHYVEHAYSAALGDIDSALAGMLAGVIIATKCNKYT